MSLVQTFRSQRTVSEHLLAHPPPVAKEGLAGFAQRLQESLPIPVLLENLRPVTAPGHHVLHRAQILDTNRPRHGPGRLPRRNPAAQAQ